MSRAQHESEFPREWPELSVVQRWFQAVVTHPKGIDEGVESNQARDLIPLSRAELEQIVTRSGRVSARDRLAIYANAYYARLIECMGNSFPILKRTLGDESFNGFAFGYLHQYPSGSYTLSRLGTRFAVYLDETRPDRSASEQRDETSATNWPDFLVDLATLEWTIDEVFDGPGVEGRQTLQTENLLAIDPERWGDVVLQTVPCLRLLKFRYPVSAYYTEMRQTEEGRDTLIPGPRETYLAVTRRGYVVRRHPLNRVQYDLLLAIQQGYAVGEAIANASLLSDLDDDSFARELQEWFRNWTESQFFYNLDHRPTGEESQTL